MAPPSSVLYRWCTTLLNREAPLTARKESGFAGGEPVPSGNSNDLWGVLSDWAVYWSTLPLLNRSYSVAIPIYAAAWQVTIDDAAPTQDYLLHVGGPSSVLAAVRIARVSGTTGRARTIIPIEGGELDSVSVTVIDVGGPGNYTITVDFHAADGSVDATASYSGTATGTVAIPVTVPGSWVGPGYVRLTVTPDASSGAFVELGFLTIVTVEP